MFLKENPSGAGDGTLDQFLAVVAVRLAFEHQVTILCSCSNAALLLQGE